MKYLLFFVFFLANSNSVCFCQSNNIADLKKVAITEFLMNLSKTKNFNNDKIDELYKKQSELDSTLVQKLTENTKLEVVFKIADDLKKKLLVKLFKSNDKKIEQFINKQLDEFCSKLLCYSIAERTFSVSNNDKFLYLFNNSNKINLTKKEMIDLYSYSLEYVNKTSELKKNKVPILKINEIFYKDLQKTIGNKTEKFYKLYCIDSAEKVALKDYNYMINHGLGEKINGDTALNSLKLYHFERLLTLNTVFDSYERHSRLSLLANKNEKNIKLLEMYNKKSRVNQTKNYYKQN